MARLPEKMIPSLRPQLLSCAAEGSCRMKQKQPASGLKVGIFCSSHTQGLLQIFKSKSSVPSSCRAQAQILQLPRTAQPAMLGTWPEQGRGHPQPLMDMTNENEPQAAPRKHTRETKYERHPGAAAWTQNIFVPKLPTCYDVDVEGGEVYISEQGPRPTHCWRRRRTRKDVRTPWIPWFPSACRDQHKNGCTCTNKLILVCNRSTCHHKAGFNELVSMAVSRQ